MVKLRQTLIKVMRYMHWSALAARWSKPGHCNRAGARDSPVFSVVDANRSKASIYVARSGEAKRS